MIAAVLRERGHEVVRSREPTDGKWGRMLRASATTGRLPIEEELRALSFKEVEEARQFELALRERVRTLVAIADEPSAAI